VVVDEAHHAAAASYRTALAHLGFLPLEVSSESGELEAPTHDDVAKMKASLAGWDARAPKDRLLIGVTATPNRSDAIGLECVFQTIAYSYGLKQAIEDGWLVPPVPWVIETKTSLDQVRTTAGEFNQKDLAEAVNTPERNALALRPGTSARSASRRWRSRSTSRTRTTWRRCSASQGVQARGAQRPDAARRAQAASWPTTPPATSRSSRTAWS
jgi:superfamily II DNA or RNA helicase